MIQPVMIERKVLDLKKNKKTTTTNKQKTFNINLL